MLVLSASNDLLPPSAHAQNLADSYSLFDPDCMSTDDMPEAIFFTRTFLGQRRYTMDNRFASS
jgi:hypothetical protein